MWPIYEGRSINKLQNSIILVIFKVWKKSNIRFVRNFMLSTSCVLYYDDVTVTSFINIKCGRQRCRSNSPIMRNILLFIFLGQKPAHMPLFTLNCVQCIVTSVFKTSNTRKKVLSIRNDLAAVLFWWRPGCSLSTTLSWLWANFLDQNVHCWSCKTLFATLVTSKSEWRMCQVFLPTLNEKRMLFLTGYFEWQRHCI